MPRGGRGGGGRVGLRLFFRSILVAKFFERVPFVIILRHLVVANQNE